jgi:hypothetical protein
MSFFIYFFRTSSMSYTPQSDASVQRSMARSMEGSIKIMNGIGQTGLLNDVAGSVH